MAPKSQEEFSSTHKLTVEQTYALLKVDANKGLSSDEVDRRRQLYGKNEFPPAQGTPLWKLVLAQFQDILVIILIVAALISFVLAFYEEEEEEKLTAFVEPLVIVLILVANATVGVLQESSAEAAVEALKEFDPEHAKVLREGRLQNIDASELVPGDVVETEVGDQFPADIRVTEVLSTEIDVEQMMLTGESTNVHKTTDPVKLDHAQAQDKVNILFSGTTLVRGKCKGVVIATGLSTEKGAIRESLEQKAKEKQEKVPLKERLDEFGQKLFYAIMIICAVVWLINIHHFTDPAFGSWYRGAIYYFKIAVSLAVAAIPEGLPAVVTTCLALGTQRMASKNAIVTSLPAVETLGCTNVICSDKTGTLTTNQMSVQRLFVVGSANELLEFEVEGSTYQTAKQDGTPLRLISLKDSTSVKLKKGGVLDAPASFPSFETLAMICSLNNEASVERKPDGNYNKIGQSTEAALKVLTEKLLTPDAKENARIAKLSVESRVMACNKYYEEKYTKVHTMEFNRERKSMGVLVTRTSDNTSFLTVKGAWDAVLARCDRIYENGNISVMTDNARDQISHLAVDYCQGEHHYRVLALAFRDHPPVDAICSASDKEFEKLETGLIFVGMVGILDPPREEVKDSIALCKRAGIKVIMITGDNKATAGAICKKIGIIGPDERIDSVGFTGAEFKKMSPETKREVARRAKLFARVEPVDKQDLVKALHTYRYVVAMTGDGVNDAPALAEADIGVAMGTGTAVAKGAAKMVLADDNFASIVAAVEEGRNIYNNTKQFIRYLICSNIGEVVAIFITAVFGLPEVLLPVQLLWVNLVTDGLPAVALGFNKPEPGIMNQPPRARDEAIVSGFTFFRYMVVGMYVGLATVYGMVWWFCYSETGPKLAFDELFLWVSCKEEDFAGRPYSCAIFNSKFPNTMSLSILVTVEMLQAVNSLSENASLLSSSHPLSNPKLLIAMSISFGLHFVILYTPFLAKIFSIVPIGWYEWKHVLMFSMPVILVEEMLKFIIRLRIATQAASSR